MLLKLKVRVTRKDPKSKEETISFEDYLVNPNAIQAVLAVPDTDFSVIKMEGGDQILTKSTLNELVSLTNR